MFNLILINIDKSDNYSLSESLSSNCSRQLLHHHLPHLQGIPIHRLDEYAMDLNLLPYERVCLKVPLENAKMMFE